MGDLVEVAWHYLNCVRIQVYGAGERVPMQTAVDILRETFFLFEFIQILRGPVHGGKNDEA